MWATRLFGLSKPCVSTRSVVHQGGISISLSVWVRLRGGEWKGRSFCRLDSMQGDAEFKKVK
jgi:hypothetical protein